MQMLPATPQIFQTTGSSFNSQSTSYSPGMVRLLEILEQQNVV